jgi:AbiJ-like protein
LEFILNYFENAELNNAMNGILERELSGYRFVDGLITDITDPQEIEMLEEVLSDNEFPAVRIHLRAALAMLSNRENPDYRNSIKESISAVESMARIISGNKKATLGDALKIIEKQGKIHSALKDAYSKLYGYTSDEGGIRHAMLEEPNLSVSDAKFFLLSCTSFINYLKSKL